MENVLTYVEKYGNSSFEELPLSQVDILVLTELGYLPYEGIVPFEMDRTKGVFLKRVYEEYRKTLTKSPNVVLQLANRQTLLEKAAKAKRYQQVQLFGYVNDINFKKEKQFAAMVYAVGERLIVVFRGTDDTIVGWKEDLKLTYMPEIPAQRSAWKYLEKVLQNQEEQCIVAGHSKGGNLAVYSTAKLSSMNQQRIEQVYSFDGPGVHRTIIETKGYKAIREKVIAIRPYQSVVGVMMESDVPVKIIKSAGIGVMQHNSLLWTVEEGNFVELPESSRSSQELDKVLKKWVDSMTDEELRRFVDVLFDSLLQVGVMSLGDFVYRFREVTPLVLQQLKLVPEADRQFLFEKMKRLFVIRKEVVREMAGSSWYEGIEVLFQQEKWKDSLNVIGQLAPFDRNRPKSIVVPEQND